MILQWQYCSDLFETHDRFVKVLVTRQTFVNDLYHK